MPCTDVLRNGPAGRGTARPWGGPALGRRVLPEEERYPLARRQRRVNHCQGDEGSPNLQLPALAERA